MNPVRAQMVIRGVTGYFMAGCVSVLYLENMEF
jgi:hypothetical protein